MTDKTLTWVDGDVLYADDLKDSILENKWYGHVCQTTYLASKTYCGIAMHSETKWSKVSGAGGTYTIRQTADSGATWTSRNTNLDVVSFVKCCRADPTHAVAIEMTSGDCEVIFTDDSGDTWTAKTAVNFSTAIHDVAFTTAGLIVAAGNDATDYIVFSTDDGATWTDATTQPGAAVYCVDMYDANTGYCIDSSKNIWKTTNGGVDWTDTTHDSPGIADVCSIICVSETVVLLNYYGYIYYYDNSTGTSTQVCVTIKPGSIQPFNFVSYNSVIYGGTSDETTNGDGSVLIKSTDNGATWKRLNITFNYASKENKAGGIQVYGNTLLMLSRNEGIKKFNVQ